MNEDHKRLMFCSFIVGLLISFVISVFAIFVSTYFIWLFVLLIGCSFLVLTVQKKENKDKNEKIKNIDILIQYKINNEIPIDMSNYIVGNYVNKIDEIKLITDDPRLIEPIKVHKIISAHKY